jgi:quinol monooxygenase YgiN
MPVNLDGYITVPTDRLEEVRAALPDHIRLTRAEPGCERFDVTERTAQPGVFDVSEQFVDRAAFEAHQARAGASPWAEITRGVPREYVVTES